MYGFRRGSGGAGGSGNVSTLSGGANGRITLWNGPTTVTGDASGTWSGTGHTFVVGSPTFNASDGHFTGPAGASFGPSSVGGGFTNQPAGDTVTLVSDNAADNTQQVTIIGVLAGVDASENITLTDVTPVVSVGTYDKVLALVLNNACAGTVTASETSGGLTITTIAPAALSAGLQTFAAIDGYGKVLQIVASGATTKTVGIGGYALGGGIQREPVVLTGTTKVNTTNTWEGAVQFYLGDLEATRTVTLNSIAGFDFKSTGGTFEPIEAGSLAASNLTAGRVLLATTATGSTGATTVGDDAGCTWTGTGNSFVMNVGGGVQLNTGGFGAGGWASFWGGPDGGVTMGSGNLIGWDSATSHAGYNRTGIDLALSRASAGTLLVEDGSGNARDVQARKSLFYNLGGIGATDFELGSVGWVGNVFTVATAYGGTGASRQITLSAPGSAINLTAGSIATSGVVYPGSNNTDDLGLSVGLFYRTGYFGTSLYSPLLSAATNATGTNTAGVKLTAQGSLGTGAGVPGPVSIRTGYPTGTGTTQHVASTRIYAPGTWTTLTESTDTAFATVTFGASSAVGGVFTCLIEANDGTEYQATTCRFAVSSVRKAAGNTVTTIGTVESTSAASAGTLTATFTATEGASATTINANAVSSLTQTTLRVSFQALTNGPGVTVAQV